MIHASGKITTFPQLFLEHLLKNENKHQIMNVLFDTNFVHFGHVLVTSAWYLQVVKSRLYPDYEQFPHR